MHEQAHPAEARASEAEEDTWVESYGRVEFSQVGKWRWQGSPEEDPPLQDIPPGGAVPAPHRTE